MLSANGVLNLGSITVSSVSGRGFTPEELAEQALARIIYAGGKCHPAISDQVDAFKGEIRTVLVHYMKQAISSNHTTLANKFRAAGHQDLVKLLES
jgi:hypothetical protein